MNDNNSFILYYIEMEELIELLQEFNKEKWWHPWLLYEWFWVRRWDLNFIFNHSKFPFIEWLVDNDKIDRKKLEIRPFSDELVYSDSDCTVYRSDTTYEMLLMLLAIQDEPIEFLISILK